MARGRMLSKSLSISKKRAALHRDAPAIAEFAQSLYMLMIPHADDHGRLEGDPFTVKVTIDPISRRPEDDFAAALRALDACHLIRLYQVADEQLIQIIKFDEHQTGLHRRVASRFADPPVAPGNFPTLPDTVGKIPEVPDSVGNFPAPSNTSGNFLLNRTEQNGTEQNGTEAKGTEGKGTEQKVTREDARDVSRARVTQPLLRGPNPNHAFDGPRVYVPQALHRKLIALRNHPGAEAELLAWYADVSERWTHGEAAHVDTGADMFAFWQGQYAERWPLATGAPVRPSRRPAWATVKS